MPAAANVDAANNELDVGRRRDDGRVVAAELEDAAPETAGDDTCHLLTHRVEPVALTSGTPGWATRRRADIGSAEHDLAEMRRRANCRGRLIEQRAGGDRRERSEVARLPDHRVAAHDGERCVPAPHRHREVERGDHRRRPERMPLLHQSVAGTLAGDRQTVQLAAEPDGEVADVDHLLHLAECLALDLADLELNQRGRGRPCACAAATANWRINSPRSGPGVVRQAWNAVVAWSTAWSTDVVSRDTAERCARDRAARRCAPVAVEAGCTAGTQRGIGEIGEGGLGRQ